MDQIIVNGKTCKLSKIMIKESQPLIDKGSLKDWRLQTAKLPTTGMYVLCTMSNLNDESITHGAIDLNTTLPMYIITMDLTFQADGKYTNKKHTLDIYSDFYNGNFMKNNGLLVESLGVCANTVMIVKDNVVIKRFASLDASHSVDYDMVNVWLENFDNNARMIESMLSVEGDKSCECKTCHKCATNSVQ